MSTQSNHNPHSKYSSKTMSLNQIKRFRISSNNKDYVNIDGSEINVRPKTSGISNPRIKIDKQKDLKNNLSSSNPIKYFHSGNFSYNFRV